MLATEKQQNTRVSVPSDWLDQVARVEERFCREIKRVDPHEALLNLIGSTYGAGHTIIKPYLERFPQPRILEVGTGYGFSFCYLRKLGLDVEGVEPGNSLGFEGRYDQAIELLKANGILNANQILHKACGEELPFEDETFDIVFSVAVLEHVRSIEACLIEAMRVLKPRGVIVMAVPNYNSFREEHYDVFWLPHVLKSKLVAKWYVKTIFGRADWFIDELTFATPNYFRKLARKKKELQGIKLYLFAHPAFSKYFGRLVGSYYFSEKLPQDKRRFKHKFLLKVGGFLIRIGEFLGMALSYCVVCEKPDGRDTATRI